MRITIFLIGLSCLFASADAQTAKGEIKGNVFDTGTGEPLSGTVVEIVGIKRGTLADEQGNYIIADVPVGVYTVAFSYIGYQTRQVESVEIGTADVAQLDAGLEEELIRLSAMTVTPGRFAIMGKEPEARQTLTREDIQSISQFGEDIYRAVTRLPGISGNDFSARFTVRGGEHDEVLVVMDGLELYDPFHLKDINGGALSIVDVMAIEGIDLLTGGFPAEYGNRMSGVFNIKSTTQQKRRTSVGISLTNTRFMSEGSFARGNWLVSARRGYLDLVLQLMGEEESFSPTYYDVLGKVEYQLDDKHRLAFNVLQAHDNLEFVEDDEDESNTKYGNAYGWLSLQSTFSSALLAQTMLAAGHITHQRDGLAFTGDTRESLLDFTVDDRRAFDFFELKQDWNWEISQRHFLKAGADVKHLAADYDYLSVQNRFERVSQDSVRVRVDSTQVERNPSGFEFDVYVADRFRLLPPLIVELGLRYDHTSYAADNLLSPRFNLVYTLGKRTVLRGGWGHFYQSEGIHEISVRDGEETFFPAQRAQHWVAGLEHHFEKQVQLRLETYYKDLSDLRPLHRNFLNEIEIFPELQDDRVRIDRSGAVSKGLEVYLKRDAGGKFTWWASYALAQVEEDVATIGVDGEVMPYGLEVPGVFDQRQTIYVDLNYRPGRKWHMNAAWQYRTGWPYTDKVLQQVRNEDGSVFFLVQVVELYGQNYPAFHRLDLRVNRHFETKRGQVSVSLELVNLYNRGNVRTYDFFIDCSSLEDCRIEREPQFWFRLLPSVGINWNFAD